MSRIELNEAVDLNQTVDLNEIMTEARAARAVYLAELFGRLFRRTEPAAMPGGRTA